MIYLVKHEEDGRTIFETFGSKSEALSRAQQFGKDTSVFQCFPMQTFQVSDELWHRVSKAVRKYFEMRGYECHTGIETPFDMLVSENDGELECVKIFVQDMGEPFDSRITREQWEKMLSVLPEDMLETSLHYTEVIVTVIHKDRAVVRCAHNVY